MDRTALEDLFEPVGPVSIRRMFGGFGVFVDGLMVAIEAGGTIFLKSGPASAARFDALGCEPFSFMRAGRPMVTSYRRLPEAAFEDPDELRQWFGIARAAAMQAAQDEGGAKRRARPAGMKPADPVRRRRTVRD
ncbi:TfoX/Sxy family protein [Alsobacter sp. R-9]